MIRLIGREPEARQLAAAAERAQAGVNSTLTIDGESGIGKTSLLRSVADLLRRDGWMVFDCRCAELDIDRPFAALVPALRELIEDAEPNSPSELRDAANLLLQAESAHGDADQADHAGDRIRSLVLEGIHDLASTVPVALLFDDTQWIDDATARTMWGVVRRSRRAAILTIAAFVPTNRESVQTLRRSLDTTGAVTIVLKPLSEHDAQRLAEQTVGGDLSDETRELVRSARGNPLLISELCRADEATDRSDALANDAEEGSVIPERLRSLILRRLTGLPTQTRALLDDLALLGQDISVPEIARLHDLTLDESLAHLQSALDRGIIVSATHGLSFQHGLVRKIIAEHLTLPARQARHQHLAVRLTTLKAASARVAEQHWQAAPWFHDDAVTSFKAAAAEVRSLSLEAALVWLKRALLATPANQPSFTLRMDVAALYVLLGRGAEADKICNDPSTIPVTDDDVVRLNITRSTLASVTGPSRHAEAFVAIDTVLQHLSPGDPRMIDALGWKSMLYLFGGDLDQARVVAQSAIDTRVEGDASKVLCRPYEAMGLTSLLRGDVAEAQRYTELSLGSFDDAYNVLQMSILPHFARAMTLLPDRPVNEVIDTLLDGCHECDRAGHIMARLHLDPLLSICYLARGDVATARASVERTLEMNHDWRANGLPLPTVTGMAALLSLFDDDIPSARKFADRALEELLDGGSQASTADYAVWCIALVAEAEGETDKARELLTGVWELFAKDASLYVIVPDLVRLTREEQPEYALSLVERAEARAARSNAALDRAQAAAARGNYERRVELLDQAVAAYMELGWNMVAARTRERALEIVAEGSDLTEFEWRYAQSAKDWETLEVVGPARLLKERFAGRVKAAKTPKPTSGPASLSQAERAVVRLVGQGLTNKEIAQQLFVSHRTIESHVSHALAKLSLTSRVQLAGLVAREAI